RFQLRPMTRSDLDAVLDIERRSFEQPYSREILAQELKIKAAHLRVATYRRKVIGYIDFWLVHDEMELISVAVHPDFKRCGVGEGLMQEMIRFAHQNEARFIYLDVRRSNEAAQRLYEKFGFEKAGVRRRYYSDNQEDAIIMKKVLE
ncbi:MAG: ribosomal protein S18-alanine N-acetyltransferase, partial [Deltaproteobacteria bacterium]|nr:ribosomal protein S18-alanine N-acetyltransferase [Deltaproteobacteria bacterium]MCC7345174.1 ribosomal protein S18-alanine N-acetyltransferase [Deltaproteobacteria bacterium]